MYLHMHNYKERNLFCLVRALYVKITIRKQVLLTLRLLFKLFLLLYFFSNNFKDIIEDNKNSGKV